MTEHDRRKTMIAHIIRQQVTAVARHRLGQVEDLASQMSPNIARFEELRRRLEKSCRRNWAGAARRLMRHFNEVSTVLAADAQQLAGLTDLPPRSAPPSMRSVFEDLDQLDGEFDGWKFDRGPCAVSVRTDPITLEDVYLGPFEICLHLEQISENGGQPAYSCVALDPHPAAGNDHVTHPHVTDEGLCEGDAAVPIRCALESGRLADFFMVVRSVLNTYNEHSPYVALDQWCGQACEECGQVVSEDLSSCSGCDRLICDECWATCTGCDQDLCSACLDKCSVCEEPICERCTTRCQCCRERCCKQCLDGGICRTCDEKETNNESRPERDIDSPRPATTAAPAA